MCVLGFLRLLNGYVCIYSLAGKVHKVEDFEILVNEDGFEVLEWVEAKYRSVPKHSIKSCKFDFVGKHASYGLGNVNTDKKALYLPSTEYQKEYWYSTYQVLTVVHEPYNQHLSQVHYFTEKANITRQPHTLKRSRVTNNHNQEITKSVSFAETTETVRA